VRFVDTSFWVALQFRRDEHHAMARALWESDAGPVVTTNHVLGETWTFLNRRTGHRDAVTFVDAANRSERLNIVLCDQSLEDDAWRWLRRHDERTYSFVDATSFAIMRRLRLRQALAFNGDFAAAGFLEMRA
jgi:uncharacterized protein